MGGVKMKDWIDTIEARTRAQAKYDKEHTKGLYIKLNIRTDLDIIQWLWAQPSKQGAIKALIRQDIALKQQQERNRTRCLEISLPFNWDNLYNQWVEKKISSKEFMKQTGIKKMATFYNLLTEYTKLLELEGNNDNGENT